MEFENEEAYAFIAGTNTADTITNSGEGATVDGGKGDDEISNEGVNSSIGGGKGDDEIENTADYATIDGGKGDDVISNDGESSYVYAGTGDDEVINSGDNAALYGENGDDTISNDGLNAYIDGGKGDDEISNYGDDSTIYGENGDDYISNEGESSYIYGGKGDDTVWNYGEGATLNGDKGEDEIYNYGAGVYAYGGDGDDTIQNYAYTEWNEDTQQSETVSSPDNTTISGGYGNDYIYNEGEDVLFTYADGDGYDTIAGFSDNSTLQIDGSFESVESGDDVIVTVGYGEILLVGAATLSTLNIIGTNAGTEYYDDSSPSKVTLPSDIVTGDATARTKAIRINGNAFDNTILGGSGKDTLYGKDGNDYLEGNGGADKLYGNDGDDTLWGGIGNDTLTGGDGADTFIYNGGEGKDVIADFSDDDLLQITGDFTAKYYASSNKITFKVDNTSNALTLRNFTATTFNINGEDYHISGSKLVK